MDGIALENLDVEWAQLELFMLGDDPGNVEDRQI